jgi:hypothetical protein
MDMNQVGYFLYMESEDKRAKVNRICDNLENGFSFEETVTKEELRAIEAEMKRRGKPIECY